MDLLDEDTLDELHGDRALADTPAAHHDKLYILNHRWRERKRVTVAEGREEREGRREGVHRGIDVEKRTCEKANPLDSH